jgi:SanA protein
MRLRKVTKMILILCLVAVLGAIVILGIPRLITELYAVGKMFQPIDAPEAPVAIVFGAGLQWDGSPTAVLQDRVATAVDLYFQGKVSKLIMSGDNRSWDYNEPAGMQAFAIQLGVPEEDIILDYAGLRTYDTCYRAREIFGVKEALLVTQKYHLPRAIFTCNELGVKSVGVIADRRVYRQSSLFVWQLREVPATLVALVEVWVTHPLPILGEPLPIFPEATNPQDLSNSNVKGNP